MGERIKDGETGRFLKVLCPDFCCNGKLVAGSLYGRPVWECDGLTHLTDDGPLVACDRSYSRAA